MNWLDIVVVIMILFFGVVGFKRGGFKEIILFIGIILVFVVSYKLKNYIGDFLVLNFPFVSFNNIFNGASALNIILYQSIAFVIVAIILYAIYEFIVSITGIFEKILRFTIILGIPSKILGFFIGLIKGIVTVYIFLFFITQPALNLKFAKDSKIAKTILNNTPILNNITKDTVKIFDEIYSITEIDDVNETNLRIVDLILKNKITSVEIIEQLAEKNKLEINNIGSILNKYKGE